jgi:hypothetical protein
MRMLWKHQGPTMFVAFEKFRAWIDLLLVAPREEVRARTIGGNGVAETELKQEVEDGGREDDA